MITVKGFTLIRINLHRCFRGDAQVWYITELTNTQRAELIREKDIYRWKEKLSQRFKMNEADAMILLNQNKYTVENVRHQRQISSYVQSVVRHCNDADLVTVRQQLNWTWNHLDSDLQRDVNKPDASTTVLSFIQQLKDMQGAWKRYYAKEPLKKQWQLQQATPSPPQPYHNQSANQDHYPRDQQYNNDGKRYFNNDNNGYSPEGRNNQQWINNQRDGQDHNY